jgi:hypothetical protein
MPGAEHDGESDHDKEYRFDIGMFTTPKRISPSRKSDLRRGTVASANAHIRHIKNIRFGKRKGEQQ